MTVLEVIQRSTDYLAKKGIDSPRLQVELLLAHRLATRRLNLYLQFERHLSEAELTDVRATVQRRGRREPLQHILGSAGFYGMDLKCDGRALIPRPETERLVESVLDHVNGRGGVGMTVLDFGTGSGCIAIALAVQRPDLVIHAGDCSAPAIELARENAARQGVLERVSLRHGDGFAAWTGGERFDVIVSNPPYIPTAEIEELQPEVRDHDPRVALDGGPDGLDGYRLIGCEAPGRLTEGGRLFLELGDGQAGAVKGILEAHKWIVERIENDYSGRPRVLQATWKVF
jgi:release factor glutamine methyltransferase